MAKFWCWLFGHKLTFDSRPSERHLCYRCLRWCDNEGSYFDRKAA